MIEHYFSVKETPLTKTKSKGRQPTIQETPEKEDGCPAIGKNNYHETSKLSNWEESQQDNRIIEELFNGEVLKTSAHHHGK